MTAELKGKFTKPIFCIRCGTPLEVGSDFCSDKYRKATEAFKVKQARWRR